MPVETGYTQKQHRDRAREGEGARDSIGLQIVSAI